MAKAKKSIYDSPYKRAVRAVYMVAYLYLLKQIFPQKKFSTRSQLLDRLSEILHIEDKSIENFLVGDITAEKNTEYSALLFLYIKNRKIHESALANDKAMAAYQLLEKELLDSQLLKQAIEGNRNQKEIEKIIGNFLLDKSAMNILKEISKEASDLWISKLRLFRLSPARSREIDLGTLDSPSDIIS